MTAIKNNFGVLKGLGFEKLSEEQQLEMLVEKKLYESFGFRGLKTSVVMNLNEPLEIINSKSRISPTYIMREELYLFLIKTFQNEVDRDFLFFFKDFEEEIFGLEYADQRKIGVKYFKEKITKVIPKGFELVYKTISENGLEVVKRYNRFKFLKSLRTAVKSSIATDQNIKAYATGDESYFQSSQFKEQEVFQRFLDFESTLKIVLSLNDRYQFEEDAVFSNLGALKECYQIYKNVFLDFDIFRWTQKKTQSFIDHRPSNIDSLHQALLELFLISEKKTTFIAYINKEHSIPITKIRHYARGTNFSHDFRIKKIKEELQDLTLKK